MRASLLSLLLLPLLACAQSWCPPGATWTFNYSDMMNGWHGITRVELVGDSMVGGLTAQKLRETNVIAPFGTTDYTAYAAPISLLTREADGVVYVWGGWPEAYDTLMWFGASPGQSWSTPHMNDPFHRLTVLDTSTVVVDSEPLRRLVVQFGGWEGIPPDTLHERLGFSLNYLNGWSWFITDQPWWGLRCYRDDEMTYIAPNVMDCGYTLTVKEDGNGHRILPFPNPGTIHFNLDLPPGPHTITLFDATRRMVLQQRTTDPRPVIATEALPAGLYRIAVRDEQGAVMGATWVKEY